MKESDIKRKLGDKNFFRKKEKSISKSQESVTNGLPLIYNEDTKSLPIVLKEKITTALSGATDEKILAFLAISLNCEEIRQDTIKVIN